MSLTENERNLFVCMLCICMVCLFIISLYVHTHIVLQSAVNMYHYYCPSLIDCSNVRVKFNW